MLIRSLSLSLYKTHSGYIVNIKQTSGREGRDLGSLRIEIFNSLLWLEILGKSSPALIFQSADLQTPLMSERDVAHHVCQFFLYQLIRRQRLVELPSLQHVGSGYPQTCFGRTERAPGNAVPSVVQTAEWPLLSSLYQIYSKLHCAKLHAQASTIG